MAEVIFSRIGGFRFNNVIVDNMRDDDIYLLDVNRNATPTLTRYDFVVPRRHGSVSYDNRFEDRYIDVTIGIYAKEAWERKIKQRLLLQEIIGVEGKLLFNDDPSLFYKAKVYDEIQVTEGEVFTEIRIPFKCSYCMYRLVYNESDFKDEEPVRYSITNSGTITAVNYGNFEAKPIVEISGTATLIIVTVNDTQFSVANVSGTVYVDSEKMIVYRIVNNKKVSKLTDFTGLFPLIKKKENSITVGGTSVNATTNIRYRDTYIV